MPHFTLLKNNLGSKCIRIKLNDKKGFSLAFSTCTVYLILGSGPELSLLSQGGVERK